MFSGIVEECATLVALVKEQENVPFTFKCSFVNELKIDQSVSHNGVCLTVVSMTEDSYTVTAMKETLERSNLGLLKVGDSVNVERSVMMNGRLDGHIVQGHVDQTATCMSVEDAEGSYYFTFRYAFDKEMPDLNEWMKVCPDVTYFSTTWNTAEQIKKIVENSPFLFTHIANEL